MTGGQVRVLVLFVDVRGFTRWSESNEAFANLDGFVSEFGRLLAGNFGGWARKGLGDGAMLVRELRTEEDHARLFADVLPLIDASEAAFLDTCRAFAEKVGQPTDLRLGWGLTRGTARKLKGPDYVGSTVNKAARLCDMARPYGIVADKADFPVLPETARKFFEQKRRPAGMVDDVDVWVTEEIASQLVPRERLRETPEVHVAGVCVDPRQAPIRVLLARRSRARKLYPGLIEGCGGQLRRSESFVDGVRRHFELEMGLSVSVRPEFHLFYSIEASEEPLIPGIRFLCERTDDREPKSPNHTETWWATGREVERLDAAEFIPGLKEQMLDLLRRYQAGRRRRPARGALRKGPASSGTRGKGPRGPRASARTRRSP